MGKFILNLTIEEAEKMILRLLKGMPDLAMLGSEEMEVNITRSITANRLDEIEPVDVGIVIALAEEFQEIFPQIHPTFIFVEEINQYFYTFERSVNDKYKYSCVITFIGGMGVGKAALVGDRLINYFKPTTIINIGIAGSMDKDILVGDVIVAEQADDYLYAAKAIIGTDNRNFDFQLSGDPYKSTPTYVKHAENLRYAHKNAHQIWLQTCGSNIIELIEKPVQWGLLHKGFIRENPELHTGNIASGTVVGATDLFVQWLKDRDRKYMALEMEAAGVLSAAYTRSVETIIIRGISDYSDHRKKEFDTLGSGALRRYAMNNAIALLWTMMDLQLVKPNKNGEKIRA